MCIRDRGKTPLNSCHLILIFKPFLIIKICHIYFYLKKVRGWGLWNNVNSNFRQKLYLWSHPLIITYPELPERVTSFSRWQCLGMNSNTLPNIPSKPWLFKCFSLITWSKWFSVNKFGLLIFVLRKIYVLVHIKWSIVCPVFFLHKRETGKFVC